MPQLSLEPAKVTLPLWLLLSWIVTLQTLSCKPIPPDTEFVPIITSVPSVVKSMAALPLPELMVIVALLRVSVLVAEL